MTRYLVKLLIHDWPRRSMQSRKEVAVDAESPGHAMDFAVIEAAHLWPGGKARAYDAVPQRGNVAMPIAAPDDAAAPVEIPLFQKRGPGRPRKVA